MRLFDVEVQASNYLSFLEDLLEGGQVGDGGQDCGNIISTGFDEAIVVAVEDLFHGDKEGINEKCKEGASQGATLDDAREDHEDKFGVAIRCLAVSINVTVDEVNEINDPRRKTNVRNNKENPQVGD